MEIMTAHIFSTDDGRCFKPSLIARVMSTSQSYEYSTLNVTSPAEYVKHVELNRPEKRNAMNTAFWREIKHCFIQLREDEYCRAIVLSGAGKMFSAGLDLQDNEVLLKKFDATDVYRKSAYLRRKLTDMQESFNVLETCHKPVIASVHSACIGGGIDMISACDIRYCTEDAWFTIKEVDIGAPADLGTLQRFQKIVGNDSSTRELVYTARHFHADEAKSLGFVNRVFSTKEEMIAAAINLAKVIACKSPVAIQGSKVNLVYARDHKVSEGLQYQVMYNILVVQSDSEDVMKSTLSTT